MIMYVVREKGLVSFGYLFQWHINHLYHLMPNLLYTYILNMLDLVLLGFIAYQPFIPFNAKSSLYIYIKYVGFGFVEFYGISTIYTI